jgi:hypothetical protein
MMSIASLAIWAQLISSIAVLGTLVYLAIEIKQNTLASHAVSRQAMFDGLHQELHKLIDHPDVAFGIGEHKSILTDEDKMKIYHFYVAAMRAREFAWFQFQSGVLDEKSWESYRNIIMIVLGTERAQRWWKSYQVYMDVGFVSHVNEMLGKEPLNDYWKNVLKLT